MVQISRMAPTVEDSSTGQPVRAKASITGFGLASFMIASNNVNTATRPLMIHPVKMRPPIRASSESESYLNFVEDCTVKPAEWLILRCYANHSVLEKPPSRAQPLESSR